MTTEISIQSIQDNLLKSETFTQTCKNNKITDLPIQASRILSALKKYCITSNKSIKDIDVSSIYVSACKFVNSGINPEDDSHYYLFVGRGSKLEFKISPTGYKALFAKDKKCKFVLCDVVYEGDNFQISPVDDGANGRTVKHTSNFLSTNITYAYAYTCYNGIYHCSVVNRFQIDECERKSREKWNKGVKSHTEKKEDSVWSVWFDEMAKKIPLRRLAINLNLEGASRLNEVDNEDYDMNKSTKEVDVERETSTPKYTSVFTGASLEDESVVSNNENIETAELTDNSEQNMTITNSKESYTTEGQEEVIIENNPFQAKMFDDEI